MDGDQLSNAKQILAMLRSRAEGDEDAFFSIALGAAARRLTMGFSGELGKLP
jgi:hypothetical protein